MRRCYGCMREFDDIYEVCPQCGFIVGTAPKVKSHLPCGTKLYDGRYILGKVLGHGGFGITYIAWDSKRSRPVAVKEFFPNSLSTRGEGESTVSCYNSRSEKFFKDGVKKMLDEAERLSKFHKNENIVNVYDYFEANKTAYIVMEYLEGKDLKKYLEERGGKLDADEAIEIILPVLNALNDMHKANLIHRDISPDNIFICNNGKVKILDFGSARIAVEDADKSMSVMLKKGYAPKEQYASRSKQGPWTDVYAASATLYETVTGRKPVDSMERDVEQLKTFKELGILGMGELENIIRKGMAPEVADRTPDAATLYAELADLIRPSEGTVPDFVPKPPKEYVPEGTKKKSKKPLIAAAIIVAVVAAGAVGGKLAWDRFYANPAETTLSAESTSGNTTESTSDAQISEMPAISQAAAYQFANGEVTLAEKLSAILSDNKNVYMADINGDGNSEIINIKETENNASDVFVYTTLADGSIAESRLACGKDITFRADTEKNVLILEDKTPDEDGYRYTAVKISVDPAAGFVLGDKITVGEKDLDGDFNASQTESMVIAEYDKKYAELTNGLTLADLSELNSEGSCGENSNWIYHKGANLLRVFGSDYIEGKGPMDSDETPWSEIAPEVKTVILSKDITGIGRLAFADFVQLEEILIGERVSSIEDGVFSNCRKLRTIKLQGIRNIGSYVFDGSGVEEITVGRHLTKAESDSFFAPNLKKITVEEGGAYSTDSSGILYKNNELVLYPAGRSESEYTVSSEVSAIGAGAFRNAKNLKKIILHENIRKIDESAFSGCESLVEIRIPESVSVIPQNCFSGCSSLNYVEISEGVTAIEDFAFLNCTSLKFVMIPSSVTEMGNEVFSGCSILGTIEVNKKQSECSGWKNWSENALVKYKEETTTGRFPIWGIRD